MKNSLSESEFQLIERMKNGERAAFDFLIEKYKEKAFALAFSFVGNYEDARDILQEAFVKAYVNIKDFKGNSNFYTWFYSILVNLCRDFLRRRAVRSKFLASPLKLQDEEEKEMIIDAVDNHPNPAEAAVDKEIKGVVDEAVSLLPEKQRSAFILKHIQGMKLSEIAAILNCRESTVKVHLFRAVRSLQKKLLPYLLTEGGK